MSKKKDITRTSLARVPNSNVKGQLFVKGNKLSCGRPKNKNSITNLLRMKMSVVPTKLPDGRKNQYKRNWAWIIMELILERCAQGDMVALQMLWNRLEGKVPDILHHGMDETSPELVDLIKKRMMKW